MYRQREVIRDLVAKWLQSNTPCAEVIEDLQPVYGGCMVDLVSVKTSSMTAVVIPTGGCVSELLGRVEATKGLAETLWVVTTPEFVATTVEFVPVEAGVLVVDTAEATVMIRLTGRRNLEDPRALARLLTINELRRLTGLETREYGELVREVIDTRTGRALRESVCAVLRGRARQQVCHTDHDGLTAASYRQPEKRAAGLLAAAFIGCLAGVFSPTTAMAATITGPAIAMDGDTIRIQDHRIRIWGIDSVERRQTCVSEGRPYGCGEKATGALATFLGSNPVRCEVVDTDQYGRDVARCSTNGRDVGAYMVQAGWALDYTEFSKGAYLVQETRARAAKAGIHSGTYAKPVEYRRTARAEALLGRGGSQAPAPAQGCVIKGNINARGQRLYHMPGQVDYAATGINVAKGEKWFCTKQEAENAGWFAASR